jgi:hypothetical protein
LQTRKSARASPAERNEAEIAKENRRMDPNVIDPGFTLEKGYLDTASYGTPF